MAVENDETDSKQLESVADAINISPLMRRGSDTSEPVRTDGRLEAPYSTGASPESGPELASKDARPAQKPNISGQITGGDLFAGAGVKLKGKIFSCNILTIEGEFEGQLNARQLVISKGGFFKGTAEVEEADIGGRFNGTLRVSGCLTVRRNGIIQGKISYGEIAIEPGGEVRGQVAAQFGRRK
jgi:cytoskeletal protein CcmA (bactofilin family)